MKQSSVRTLLLVVSLLLHWGFRARSHAAAGDVDLSFDAAPGINDRVNAVAVQPDGKVLIGGQFTTVKGLVRKNLARLNADGSCDSGFDAAGNGVAYTGVVYALAPVPDGRVMVGHAGGLTRLHSNGSVDEDFDATISSYDWGWDQYFPAAVHYAAVQPDGRVIIGGEWDTVNGMSVGRIVRLHADGSLDPSFNAGPGFGGGASAVALQADGRVLVRLNRSTAGSVNHVIVRLNTNGGLDTGFDPGTGANGFIGSVASQPDGRVLIGGWFTSVNGTNRNQIARLNADGSVDDSFRSGISIPGFPWEAAVISVAVQTDGKVLIGGSFMTVDGVNRNRIARLNADGTLDHSFDPGVGIDRAVTSVTPQPDGKVFVAGDFTRVNGTTLNRMARLNANGSLDAGFQSVRGVESPVSSLVLQPDGKVLIGGPYTFINGTHRYAGARLNPDGSVDSTFTSNTTFHPDMSFVYQNDCRGGPDFECSQSWVTNTVLAQADGKVLVGGYSATVDVDLLDNHPFNSYRPVLARVHADGSRDTGFAPVIGGLLDVPLGVSVLAVQPDGKVLFGGAYFQFGRRNADGSPDGGFDPGLEFGSVASIALQADGKVVIGGGFVRVHGTIRHGIARLNPNGSLDGSFNPGPSAFPADLVALQPDGKVIIWRSDFHIVNGTSRMARLNADGSLDSSFNPGTGADRPVRSITVQPDGNILISGDFLTVNGVVRPYVARLHGNSTPPSFAAWALGYGMSGAVAAADADPDCDGLSNGVEHVLGGNPAVPAPMALVRPAVGIGGGGLVFTFPRADASETPDLTLTVQAGSDLVLWPQSFSIGPTTATSSPGVIISENGAAADTVTVTIPSGTATRLFARLRVSVAR